MKKDELQERIYQVLAEAKQAMQSDNPDGLLVDKYDMELTSLMSSANLVRASAENEANTWKMITGSMQEVVRSLRRIHETINTERRMS